MSDDSIPPPLQIPTVTCEDLYNFHVRVFGSPAPGRLFQTEPESYDEATYAPASQVEDDDLGYYPDGVKRTLTDDQIAMFRHSEIYAILRERQVRKENLEADGGDQSDGLVSEPGEAVEAPVSSDEEGEVRSGGEVEEAFPAAAEVAPQHVEATHARRKRKRGNTGTRYEHGKKYASRSARGVIRELDSAAAEDQVLDYGDELSTVETTKRDEAVGRQVTERDRERQACAVEGKKIWWPIIEAT